MPTSTRSAELPLWWAVVNDTTQGNERGTYLALARRIHGNVGSPTGRIMPHGDRAPVVVRGRESRPHGEGGQVFRLQVKEEVCAMQDAKTVLGVIRDHANMKHWRAGGWETGISGSAGGRRKRPAQAGPRRRPTRSREPAPAPSACGTDPPNSDAATRSASYLGQVAVGPGSAMVCRLARAAELRDARYGGALASAGMGAVTALEASPPRGSAGTPSVGPGADQDPGRWEPTG